MWRKLKLSFDSLTTGTQRYALEGGPVAIIFVAFDNSS